LTKLTFTYGCEFLSTEQVIDGLDRAVKTMKKGEVAVVTIQPEYAFGPSETQQELAIVPANSTVYYEVELLSFEKVSMVYCIYLCDVFVVFG
jgi:FKBP-type peptidyl-prolyl cis-trans isomerase